MTDFPDASVFRHLASLLLANLTPEALLAEVTRLVGEIFQADCFLATAPPNQEALCSTYCNPKQGIASHYAVNFSPCAWESLPIEMELLVISDTQDAETDSLTRIWTELPIRAVLGTRLLLPNCAPGFMSVMRSQPYEWTASEINCFRMISDQVTVAISQVIQAQSMVSLQQQLSRQSQRQALFDDLTIATRNSLNLDELLSLAITGMAQTLQVDQSVALLIRYSDPRLKSRSIAYAESISQGLHGQNLQAQNLQAQNLQAQNLQAQNLQAQNAQTQNARTQKRGQSKGQDADPKLAAQASVPMAFPPLAIQTHSPEAGLSHSDQRTGWARAIVACQWTNQEQGSSIAPASDSPSLSSSPTLSSVGQSFWVSECILCQQAFLASPHAVAIPSLGEAGFDHSPDPHSPYRLAPVFDPAMPAVLITALESQGAILGFLVLQHSQPRSWQASDVELMELVAAQVSTAIIHTQTLKQVQSLVDERTIQLQRSLEVQAKLYERTRRQIDQLRHLNQVKDEFLSTMSHELLTPLTSMTLAIRMLRQNNLPEERRIKYLDILEQQCYQETTLINDLLTLQKLESKQSPLQLQKLDLKLLLQELVPEFEQKWADKALTLVLDLPQRSLFLQTDVSSLRQILAELLTNAGKYSDPGSTVSLAASHQLMQQTNQVVLTLRNQGSGIGPEDLPHVFDKFWRGHGVMERAIQGTGLGLALVKYLVQHLNGTIEAFSSPIAQAHEVGFVLTLPQFLDENIVQ